MLINQSIIMPECNCCFNVKEDDEFLQSQCCSFVIDEERKYKLVECKDCFIKRVSYLDFEKGNTVIKCLNCNQEVGLVRNLNINNMMLKFIEPKKSENLFKLVKFIFEKSNDVTFDMEKFQETVKDFSKENKAINNFPICLTPEQTIELIKLYKSKNIENYKLEKLLFSLCITPWIIPPSIGRSGSCYHGNFAETPGLMEGLNYFTYNYMHVILKKKFK